MTEQESSPLESASSIGDVKFFIRGAVKGQKCNQLELTKVSLNLLRTLPATRGAVFDYFCKVFSNAALNYIDIIETEIKTGKLPAIPELDELILTEIHGVLVDLIAEDCTGWATIISTWSLELLGEISAKYAGRSHNYLFCKVAVVQLNEKLQLWMNCRATRTLVDITTKCLSSLIHSDAEACINTLLDTSVRHFPHFDWVVAHVGSCYPNTVITKVLSCGLEDFYQNKSYEQGLNSPKLRSVVGILRHLASSHTNDIRKAMLEMFNWSLRDFLTDTELERQQKRATLPYILQLCYLSTRFLPIISYNIKQTLSFDVIARCYNFIEDWSKFFGSPETLEDIVVNLILRCTSCTSDGIKIITIFLDCIKVDKIRGSEQMKAKINEKAAEMLQMILFKIEESTRKKHQGKTSFCNETNEINDMLLSKDVLVAETAAKITIYLGQVQPSNLIKSLTFLLLNAENAEQLSVFVKIASTKLKSEDCKNEHVSVVLEQILGRHVLQVDNKMWTNLLTLLEWEKSGHVPALNSGTISKAIESNLEHLSVLFSTTQEHVHLIANILDIFLNDSKLVNFTPQIQVVLNLTQSTIDYFFVCCKETGTSTKIRGFERVCKLLRKLCTFSKVSKVLALRELLERSLFRQDNVLFGARNNGQQDEREKMLLKQNKKINKTIPLTKHSSIFNGGIIGLGKRKSISFDEKSDETIHKNTSQLINSIKACCSLPDLEDSKFCDLSLDSMTLVSLLLVQFVSPDVMYNGLPWPEEEFSKVTIERDLFIRRMFANSPLLWDLLNFVALHRPAICYCSVLIRALISTLIHQWKSMGEQSKIIETEQYKSLMDTTVRIIDIMSLGQLLPHPLSSIRDILHHLKCNEIVVILRECIWCYMRDHIPSPQLFVCDSNGIYWRDPILARPPEVYTNALRLIMQRNIKNLGHMYAQMFVHVKTE